MWEQVTQSALGLTAGEILGVATAYLLGCFTTGYYLVHWQADRDIRSTGSGNVGAKNVGRLLGPWGFALTFLGDFAKGAAAVGLARHWGFEPLAVTLVLLAVVIGHNWPIQLHFQGGKGVSTSLGAILFFDPSLAALLAITWLVALVLLRRFTLSGLAAFASSPLFFPLLQVNRVYQAGAWGLAILILVAHRQNLRQEWHRLKPDKKCFADRGIGIKP